MNPLPPVYPSPTRRDDLASVVRAAAIPYLTSDMNGEALLEATRRFIRTLEADGIPRVLVGGLAGCRDSN